MIEVAGLYIAELLESPAAALQFEAARALLRLSSLAQRVAQSGAPPCSTLYSISS
jgi:hypothetical protein